MKLPNVGWFRIPSIISHDMAVFDVAGDNRYDEITHYQMTRYISFCLEAYVVSSTKDILWLFTWLRILRKASVINEFILMKQMYWKEQHKHQ